MNNAIKWLKDQEIKGIITGSCTLDYFEGADVDFFAYNKSAFTEIFYAMWHNPDFQILDKMELWKAEKFIKSDNDFHKFGVQTIKFHFNTCLPVNIILKKNCSNAFSVLSSFDMSIICKGYDTFVKKELDLTDGTGETKIAVFNKWNPAFYSDEDWQISRILRQIERVIKYWNRGFDTDAVVLKYIELIDKIQERQDIFNSDSFTEKLKIRKNNTKIIKEICEVWLKTHEISEKQIKVIKEKIKEI